jgi:hypothetical protein
MQVASTESMATEVKGEKTNENERKKNARSCWGSAALFRASVARAKPVFFTRD